MSRTIDKLIRPVLIRYVNVNESRFVYVKRMRTGKTKNNLYINGSGCVNPIILTKPSVGFVNLKLSYVSGFVYVLLNSKENRYAQDKRIHI